MLGLIRQGQLTLQTEVTLGLGLFWLQSQMCKAILLAAMVAVLRT